MTGVVWFKRGRLQIVVKYNSIYRRRHPFVEYRHWSQQSAARLGNYRDVPMNTGTFVWQWGAAESVWCAHPEGMLWKWKHTNRFWTYFPRGINDVLCIYSGLVAALRDVWKLHVLTDARRSRYSVYACLENHFTLNWNIDFGSQLIWRTCGYICWCQHLQIACMAGSWSFWRFFSCFQRP